MSRAEEMLRELTFDPPADALDPAVIRRRARVRTLRKRAVAGAAMVVAMGAVATAVTAWGESQEDRLATDGGRSTAVIGPTWALPTTTASTTGATPARDPETPYGMAVNPEAGLVDGTVVTITFDDPQPVPGGLIVAQCASEVLASLDTRDSTPVNWCRLEPTPGSAVGSMQWAVSRTIETQSGTVDCAQPGRCVLAVRVGGLDSPDDRHAPLVFAPGLDPLPTPRAEVVGADGAVADGHEVQVRVTGLSGSAEEVLVAQCIGPPDPSGDDLRCDFARSVTAIGRSAVTVPMRLFYDVFGSGPSAAAPWAACEPCFLRISTSARRRPVAQIPVTLAPTSAPIRPTIALDPAGPLAPGQVARLMGSGFQPGTEVTITWCRSGADPVDGPACVAAVRFGLVDDRGRFLVDDYRLPPAGFALDGVVCSSRPGACGVAWQPATGLPLPVFTPLDLSG